MSETYDCIVLGVGGFGSGALYHLANRGQRVLGLEQFDVAHDRGSSHGETRIIRQAYFEHPDYVPLLFWAYELWERLEQESGQRLLHKCGLLLAGPPQGEAVFGARLSARLHDLCIHNVARAEASTRFPGFRFPDAFDVVYEPEAGFLEVENCVRAHVAQARLHGADLRTREAVLGWSSDGRTIRVRTESGEYAARALIVTAGPWAGQILSDLQIPLEVVRKVLFWHAVATRDHDLSGGAAAFLFEMPDGVFYGFPSLDGRVMKIAEHSGGQPVQDPAAVDRHAHPEDVEPLSRFIDQVLPGVRPRPERHCVCMYTNTPDRHFVIDRHPQFENVVFGAGFSGHGFKFTSVLGQALADLALEGRTSLPIGFLSMNRSTLRPAGKETA